MVYLHGQRKWRLVSILSRKLLYIWCRIYRARDKGVVYWFLGYTGTGTKAWCIECIGYTGLGTKAWCIACRVYRDRHKSMVY